MRRAVLLILCVLAAAGVVAQDGGVAVRERGKLAYTGFSGGMMVHTGYLYGGNISLTNSGGSGTTSGTGIYSRKIEGAPTGIGGVARVHLGKHLRVGSEGYVSTLKYGGKSGKSKGSGGAKNDSHARIGWGGVLADCIWRFGNWAPYVGGTIGGGGFKNLTLTAETPLDYETERDASYRKYTFMVLAPFAGVEYSLTDKIRLNLKADWLLNLTNRQRDFATGPRIYIGFSFYRLKE